MERIGPYEIQAKVAEYFLCQWFLCCAIEPGGPYRAPAREVLLGLFNTEETLDFFVHELLEEARLFAERELPSVQRVLTWQGGEQAYCVLERVEGWSLARLIASRSPLSPGAAIALARALCRALAAFQALTDAQGQPLGVVHRGIAPQTVMIGVDGEVRLFNPGLMSFMRAVSDREVRARWRSRRWSGFAFLSPEQVLGRPLDHRSDLFSLGSLLFAVSTGRSPFARQTDLDTLMAIQECRIAPAAELGVPAALAPIVDRLLRLEPEERPGSAAEVDFWLELIERTAGFGDPRAVLLEEVEAAGLRESPRLAVPDLLGEGGIEL